MEITDKMLKRFWSHVEIRGQDECWPWTGGHDKVGYGIFRPDAQTSIRSNRFALITKVGPIPRDVLACHMCDNPPCCNPAHLFPGSFKDNHRDMVQKGRAPLLSEPRKLSHQDIYDIRVAYHIKKSRSVEIAKRFGIAREYVSTIANERVHPDIHPLCKNAATNFIVCEDRPGIFVCEAHLLDLMAEGTYLIPVGGSDELCQFVTP